MSKQDRQGVRTPADVERKYNLGGIKNASEYASAAQRAANDAKAAAEAAQKNAADVSDKVSKTDDEQIIAMINRATGAVTLLGNRLVVDSDNFKLPSEGAAYFKSETQDLSTSSVEISNGVITVAQSVSLSMEETKPVSYDILRFRLFGEIYILRMIITFAVDSGGEPMFSRFEISKLEEWEEDQKMS